MEFKLKSKWKTFEDNIPYYHEELDVLLIKDEYEELYLISEDEWEMVNGMLSSYFMKLAEKDLHEVDPSSYPEVIFVLGLVQEDDEFKEIINALTFNTMEDKLLPVNPVVKVCKDDLYKIGMKYDPSAPLDKPDMIGNLHLPPSNEYLNLDQVNYRGSYHSGFKYDMVNDRLFVKMDNKWILLEKGTAKLVDKLECSDYMYNLIKPTFNVFKVAYELADDNLKSLIFDYKFK